MREKQADIKIKLDESGSEIGSLVQEESKRKRKRKRKRKLKQPDTAEVENSSQSETESQTSVEGTEKLLNSEDNGAPCVGTPFKSVSPTQGEWNRNVAQEDSQCTVTDGSESIFTIMQSGTSSLLRLSLELGETPIVAAVDTAAEVTIISDKVYEALETKPPTVRETIMHAAGRGMKMKTFVVGPVQLKLGSKFYETEVYVAPIQDEMLLGLNFMVTYGVSVNLEKTCIQHWRARGNSFLRVKENYSCGVKSGD